MDPRHHWEQVYATHSADAVSWFASHLDTSLQLIRQTGLGPDAAVVDIGGGASTLVDDLLVAGWHRLTVLDLSRRALDVAAARLGARAASVHWIADDVLSHDFAPRSVDLWHDRAVFHFLTEDAQRQAYVRQIRRALVSGGFAIVGTFGPNGPDRCSGLPVMRYAPHELHACFGPSFTLVDQALHLHTTPAGTTQAFAYVLLRLDG